MDSVHNTYFSSQLLDCVHHMDKASEKLLGVQRLDSGPGKAQMIGVFAAHRGELTAALANLQRIIADMPREST